jgi:hypothetical protein
MVGEHESRLYPVVEREAAGSTRQTIFFSRALGTHPDGRVDARRSAVIGCARVRRLDRVSDLFVARDRFVERAFANRAGGLPLCYAGQLLLESAAA